jgi:hypothetical protein
LKMKRKGAENLTFPGHQNKVCIQQVIFRWIPRHFLTYFGFIDVIIWR